MQSSNTIGERFCEKCCRLLNECHNFSPAKDGKHYIDYYKIPAELQTSADGGCRGCQIFWMQMSCVNSGGIADYDMVTIEKTYLSQNNTSSFQFSMALNHKRTLDLPRLYVYIDLLDKPRPYHELPPILRLANGNVDDEVQTLMQTTIRWINNCSQNHEKCQRAQILKERSSIIPTRLIDVQSKDKSMARLVDTKELPSNIKPTYLILSYCWGRGNETAKTTRNNLCQRKHQIILCDLPKSVYDAIAVTRAMGIRYLWVDAVCIIQPDNDDFLDDWKIEAAQMGSYYSNALLCISALCTSDSSDGFLRERHSARYPWRKEERIQCGENFFSIRPPEEIIGKVDIAYMPLMARAWVLQERILSTRRLHWSGIGLLWECDSGLFQENRPLKNLRQQPDKHSLVAIADNFMRQVLSLPKAEALGIAWLSIVCQYSGMELTKPIDRLAAIHGVACRLSLQHNIEYFGGIFNGFHSTALMWRCTMIGGEEAGFIRKDFPSWSWASAKRFSYDDKYILGKPSSIIKDFVRCADPRQFPSLDEVTDFRDRSKRKLWLKAPLVSISLKPQNLTQPGSSEQLGCETSEGPIWRGQSICFRTDCFTRSPKPSTVTLLICVGERAEERATTTPYIRVEYKGLLVKRSEEDGPSAYVRLGHFEVAIPWSEEEDDERYLHQWETDVYLF